MIPRIRAPQLRRAVEQSFLSPKVAKFPACLVFHPRTLHHSNFCSRQHVLPPQEAQQPPKAPHQPPKNPNGAITRKRMRWVRIALYLLALNLLTMPIRNLIEPGAIPAPGSPLDDHARIHISAKAESLPVVQALASHPRWESWDDAYASTPSTTKDHHLTASTLSPTSALGAFRRVFHNIDTDEVVLVVHVGPALSGWPHVVHGGLLAILVDETAARAATAFWVSTARAPKPSSSNDPRPLTAFLSLSYISPSFASNVYIVRARPRPDRDLPPNERGKCHYKCWVDASVLYAESVQAFSAPAQGQEKPTKQEKVCVTAEALFINKQNERKLGGEGQLDSDGTDINRTGKPGAVGI